MSENFLSFISNVDAKPADASLSDDASPAEKSRKVLNSIVFCLKSRPRLRVEAEQEMVQQGREQAIASSETTHVEERLAL